MKKLLYLFFTLLSFTAFAQVGSQSVSGIKYRVNDTTTYQAAAATAHAQGYSDIYWNNQATNPHWDIWNGSSYDHVNSLPWAGGSGGGTWGSITGTLSSQTDLQSALDAKLPLTFTGNQTIATGGFWLRLQGTGTQIPMLALDAPNNVRKSIEFRTGNVARWQIHTENNETGSGNTGSDFHIERYNDAGAQIDAPFSIGRTDGVAWFQSTPIHDGTVPAGSNSNAIPTTAWVQGEISNNLNERVIGQILAPSIYGSGSSIPLTTVVGGLTLTLGTEVFTIQAGGNVSTHTNYVQFNAVTTSLSKYKVYTQATTGTADANSRGLFIGVVPTQTGNGNKLVAWLDCSNNATAGKAMIYINDVLVATSSTGTSNGVANGGTMTNYASSALNYELIRNKDTYTFNVHNSANEIVTVSYQFDLATGTVIKPGGSKFIIGSMSTQARNVYNFRVESDEIVYPDLLYVGDSHTNGYYAGSEAQSFPRLMEATGRSVVVSASNGALTADIALWAADFPLVKPRKVILLAGTNDAIGGVATFTFGVRHWNIYNALRATGADVWVLNLPPVSTTDVTAYNAKLGQIYGQTGRLIDIFTPLSNGGTGWNATYGSDSHMNTAGQALVHSLIMSNVFP